MYRIQLMYSMLPEMNEYVKEIEDIWKTHSTTNMGIKHNQLKDSLLEFLDVPQISLFSNGHLALEGALEAMNFSEGSEIITTPLTFASTTHAVIRKKLKPVFCDVKEDDYTIDVNCIEDLITDKTAAILPVHVYGHVCDVDAIQAIARKYNLKVIYDAAHAFGVKYKGKSVANYGDITMFSFHATKVFNTIEGGALCYNDSKLTELFDKIKNFGFNSGNVEYPGGNAKMTEFQAAMGICNLRNIVKEIEKRKIVISRYRKNLIDTKGIRFCGDQKDVESNYAYMPIVFHNYKYSRDEIQKKLAGQGIESRKYFYPLTSEFYFSKQYADGNLKNASFISNNILTLPLYGDLEMEDVDSICRIVLDK